MGIFSDIGGALFGDSPRVDWAGLSDREIELRSGAESRAEAVSNLLLHAGLQDYESLEDISGIGARTDAEQATSGLLRERLDSILKGGDDREDTAVEQDIQREYEKMEASLSEKLGPDWRLSTPGVKSLRAFNEWAQRSRSENRLSQRGYDINEVGMLSGTLANEFNQNLDASRTREELNTVINQLNNENTLNELGLGVQSVGLLSNLTAPYMSDRSLKMGQNMANAGLQSSQYGGALGLLTGGLMLGAGPISKTVGNFFSPRTGNLPSGARDQAY
jgi:hypothetical protein